MLFYFILSWKMEVLPKLVRTSFVSKAPSAISVSRARFIVLIKVLIKLKDGARREKGRRRR